MVRIDQKKIGVAIMGAKADNDLWGQALAIESQYGDRGPEVITTMIDDLRRSGDHSGAAFWTKVAVCLTDLHEIRYVGSIASPAADGRRIRSEEHTSEPQSLMRNSSAVHCLKKKTKTYTST